MTQAFVQMPEGRRGRPFREEQDLPPQIQQALVGFVVADPVPLGMACLYVLLASVRRLESSVTSDAPLLTGLSSSNL